MRPTVAQPAPAGALQCHGGGDQPAGLQDQDEDRGTGMRDEEGGWESLPLLHGGEAPEVPGDGRGEVAARLLRPAGAQALPHTGAVYM
jgi:hypothetical protein